MASEVDLCNLALARLGDAATMSSIDPPEGSAQAEHCARFYPIARDTALELHEWSFATRRATLAVLETDSWNWAYAYARPNETLRVLAVLAATAPTNSAGAEFETFSAADGSPLILTDLESATVLYTAGITDTTKFSPLFTDALAWLLASHIAGPLLKNEAGMAATKYCLSMFNAVLGQAKISDANQRYLNPTHTPDFIAARA